MIQNPEITLSIYENISYDKCDVASVKSRVYLTKCVGTIRYPSGLVPFGPHSQILLKINSR